MKIEFVDKYDYPPITGTFIAEIADVEVVSDEKTYGIRVTFLLENGRKIRRTYPTEKTRRWRLKILLRAIGIEKQEDRYIFDTEDLIGKKVCLVLEDGKIVKTLRVQQ